MRPVVVDWLSRFMPAHVAELVAPGWFTCIGIAGVVTLLWMLAIGKRQRIDRGAIGSIVLWVYVAAVIAGIAMPALIDAIEQRLATGHVHLRWSGMTSFWGYLAGLAAIVVVCRDHELPLARLGDLAAAPAGLALACARVGCFLGGCDYGKVTSLPWAVRFPQGSPAWHDQVRAGLVPDARAESLPVHPTQLYEALLGLVIVALTVAVARRAWARERQGRVALVAIVTYALGRIVVEMFRGDVGRGIYGGLSSGQIFSLCVLAVLALAWLARRRRHAFALATACAVVALTIELPSAEAQPAQPMSAQPAPPPTTQPTAQPAPQPVTAPPPMAAGPPPPETPPGQPPQAIRLRRGPHVELGVLGGFAVPLNRRPEQVGMLSGLSASAGFVFGMAGVWLDFDSYGNNDASHGTWLLSGSFLAPVARGLQIGGRGGLGTTLVNFDEPAFQDVRAFDMRIEGVVDYAIGESWALWARPLSIDIISARALGGPITTWQMRVGIAFRIGNRHRTAPPPPTPGTGQPSTGQPDPGQPGQPSTGQPNPGQPGAGQPGAGQSNPGQPNPGQPNSGQPNPGQPSGGQQSGWYEWHPGPAPTPTRKP